MRRVDVRGRSSRPSRHPCLVQLKEPPLVLWVESRDFPFKSNTRKHDLNGLPHSRHQAVPLQTLPCLLMQLLIEHLNLQCGAGWNQNEVGIATPNFLLNNLQIFFDSCTRNWVLVFRIHERLDAASTTHSTPLAPECRT